MKSHEGWIRSVAPAASLALLVILLLAGAPARADRMQEELAGQAPQCFWVLADKLRTGTPVVLHRAGGDSVTGSFDSFDTGTSVIRLQPLTAVPGALREFPLGDVTRIEYREGGRLNAGTMVLGLFGGMVVGCLAGAMVGSAMSDEQPEGLFTFSPREVATAAGGGIGAVVGLLLGTALPLNHRTCYVECRDVGQ
ncbi:MAG: hypothetical protein HZB25_04030 [Candidatus Eisenbacteria bacterium]|nr:hypothetical protein [Candidatus Eisenbacteria bacterium]